MNMYNGSYSNVNNSTSILHYFDRYIHPAITIPQVVTLLKAFRYAKMNTKLDIIEYMENAVMPQRARCYEAVRLAAHTDTIVVCYF